jgi:hypothetical protein
MIKESLIRVCGLVAFLGVLSAAPAFAESIEIRISTNKVGSAGPIVIFDNGARDLDASTGTIQFNVGLDDWTLVGSLGFGSIGLEDPGALDLSYSAKTKPGGTATALTIELTQTGTSSGFAGWTGVVSGNSSNTTQIASLTYSAYEDDTNTPFGQSTLLGSVNSTSNTQFGTFTKLHQGLPPYSLTEVIRVTGRSFGGTRSGLATGNANIVPIPTPEPALSLLLAGGLLGLAVAVARIKS